MVLYVCDLDDTLVKNGKPLPKETIDKLNTIFSLSNKELIIASARNYNAILKRIKGLKIDIKIIARNGSVVFDENGKVVFSYMLKNEEVKESFKYCIENELCPVIINLVDNGEKCYACKKYITPEYYKHTKNLRIDYFEDIDDIQLNNVIGIYAFGKIDPSKEYHIPKLKIWRDIEFIQIVNEKVDKESALKELIKNKEYESIICFGNDENDYKMLDFGNQSYYIYKEEKNNKYNNIHFDNGESILKIMNGEL